MICRQRRILHIPRRASHAACCVGYNSGQHNSRIQIGRFKQCGSAVVRFLREDPLRSACWSVTDMERTRTARLATRLDRCEQPIRPFGFRQAALHRRAVCTRISRRISFAARQGGTDRFGSEVSVAAPASAAEGWGWTAGGLRMAGGGREAAASEVPDGDAAVLTHVGTFPFRR